MSVCDLNIVRNIKERAIKRALAEVADTLNRGDAWDRRIVQRIDSAPIEKVESLVTAEILEVLLGKPKTQATPSSRHVRHKTQSAGKFGQAGTRHRHCRYRRG